MFPTSTYPCQEATPTGRASTRPAPSGELSAGMSARLAGRRRGGTVRDISRRASSVATVVTLFLGACVLSQAAWSAASGSGARAEGKVRLSQVPEIAAVAVHSVFYGYQAAVDRDTTDGQSAYDYSVHLIKDGALYRMFVGGRWRSRRRPGGDGDHVLQFVSPTGAPGTWAMPHDRPEFWQGREEGYENAWFADNYLEPEVVKVGGTYYMYTQVQISKGAPIDIPGQVAKAWADRIQLHTSSDALNWKRYSTERGVVVNLDRPADTALHHQEVLYVPWDRDGKPWWMYVAVSVNGRHLGYWRLRSSDPGTYDWRAREGPVNFSQFGNQLAYAKQAPGGPLFIRITFAHDRTGRAVPTLQFSRDGLNWFWGDGGPVKMAGSTDNDRNKNCYFLGICTINGTGELEHLGNGRYHAYYAASTSNSPVAPDIFFSEIGLGELTLHIMKAE